jgi:hypothetical protein
LTFRLTILKGFDIQANNPKRLDIQANSFDRFLTFRQAVLTGVSQLSVVFAGIHSCCFQYPFQFNTVFVNPGST